jgi:hypothetical protein
VKPLNSNDFHHYAAVMGMNRDLKLVGKNLTNAATALFLVTEVPTGRPLFSSLLSNTNLPLCDRRLHSYKGAARKMARNQHHILVRNNSIHRCREELPHESPCMPNSSRRVCSCNITLFNAHNISVKRVAQAYITGMWYTKREAVSRFLFHDHNPQFWIFFTISTSQYAERGSQHSIHYDQRLRISLLCILTALGASLMSFLPKTEKGGLLAGIYLINTVNFGGRSY